MTLKTFQPFADETRLIKHNDCLYKVKLSYKNVPSDLSIDGPSVSAVFQREIEEVLRAVVYMVQHDSPLILIQTENFYVLPTVKAWKAREKLGFRQNGKDLKVFDSVITLLLTPHFSGELWTDSSASVQVQSGNVPSVSENQRPAANRCEPAVNTGVVNPSLSSSHGDSRSGVQALQSRTTAREVKLASGNKRRHESSSPASQEDTVDAHSGSNRTSRIAPSSSRDRNAKVAGNTQKNQHSQSHESPGMGNRVSTQSKSQTTGRSADVNTDSPKAKRARRPAPPAAVDQTSSITYSRRNLRPQGNPTHSVYLRSTGRLRENSDHLNSLHSAGPEFSNQNNSNIQQNETAENGLMQSSHRKRPISNSVESTEQNQGTRTTTRGTTPPGTSRSHRAILQQKRSVTTRGLMSTESSRLRSLSMVTRSETAQSTAQTFHQKDRHLIAQEDLREELKLQQLASSENRAGGGAKAPGRKLEKSFLEMVAESVVTPLKRVLGRRKTAKIS